MVINSMKNYTKHLIIILIGGLLCTWVAFILEWNFSTDVTLGILPWSLSFTKDTGSSMNSYFGHEPDNTNSIDIGQHAPSLEAINISSVGNHRFTISDMLGSPFIITIQSSAFISTWWDSIAATNIGYTGTNRLGTGKTLTAAPTIVADIGTSPVTFVARENNSGLSLFSQEITLKVAVPAAQAPWSYTGVITFTY